MSDNFYLFRRILQVGEIRKLLDPGERTPFPIIVEQPTFKDTFFNMGLPEWTPFLVGIPSGILLGYYLTFNLQDLPLTRRRGFISVWFTILTCSWYIGFKGSFYKLIGFEDNGLRWKTPDQRVKKYIFTDGVHGFWEDLLRKKD